MAQPADDQKSESEHLWSTSLILNKAYASAFACIKCNGIPKTCMNNEDGEVLCDQCAKHDENAGSNKTVQRMINKLKTKCLSLIDDNQPKQNIVTEGQLGNNLTDEMEEGNNLMVTEHVENQCDWTDMIQEWEEHSNICPYLVIECNDCNKFKCQRKLLAQHTKECPQVMIDCSLSCGSKILRKNVETHLGNDCMEQLLDCSNDDCKDQVKRKNFENHIKNECDTRIVKCEFEKYGCDVNQIKANQLKKHMDEYKFDHLSNKFDHISIELQKENQSLKVTVAQLTKSVNTSTNTTQIQQQAVTQLTQKIQAIETGFDEKDQSLKKELNNSKASIAQLTESVNTLTNTTQNQQQTINQLTHKVQEMETAFEEEKKADQEVRFDRYDPRIITIEQNGKIVKTKSNGCCWNSVYSSRGFNSGLNQWRIKILSIGRDGASYEQVGVATEIHEGQGCCGKYLSTNGGVTSGVGFANGDVITTTLDFGTAKVIILKNGNALKSSNIDITKTYYPAITLCGCANQRFEVV